MGCDYILYSEAVFTAQEGSPFVGYVAVEGNKINAVEKEHEPKAELVDTHTKEIDFKDSTLCPGFMDNHTFFMGNMLKTLGIRLSGLNSIEAIISKAIAEATPGTTPVYGGGWDSQGWYDAKDLRYIQKMDEAFGERCVVLFDEDRCNALMTSQAIKIYGFTPEEVYPEAMHKLFRELVSRKEFIKDEFKKFMLFLNERGITSIKDIAFDDYLGMYPVLEEMRDKDELSLRVNFSSQIVAQPASIDFAAMCKEREQGYFLNFMGFKYMTDGDFDTFEGDLIEPYTNRPDITFINPVDYDTIEEETLKLDKKGYRVSIHAEGDRAVRKCVDIFEKCTQENGRRDARHSIIDLELSDPSDYKRMKQLDIQAEIYGQLMLLIESEENSFMEQFFGPERACNYLNYGKMSEAGVRISIGTDMPLLSASVPESLIALTGRRFGNRLPAEGWKMESSMNIDKVLKAWTINGAYFAFKEKVLGTLEEGKLADIAVLSANVFNTPIGEMDSVKNIFTMVDGKVVYQG